MKKCKECSRNRSLDEFHNSSKSKDGKQALCKPCNIEKVREWQRNNPEKYEEIWKRSSNNRDWFRSKASKYDIDVDDLVSLFEETGGVCIICGGPSDRDLVIDHCHTSNKIRGLLCGPHNAALGLFNDSIEELEAAIKYLNKPQIGYKPYSKGDRRVLKKSEKRSWYCQHEGCGSEVSRTSKHCMNHYSLYQKRTTKIEWPELEILVDMVQQLGYAQTGRQLNVSDNTVRKHIRKLLGPDVGLPKKV